MISFTAAYDMEAPGRGLAACRAIAAVHERMGIAATFRPAWLHAGPVL
jgi:hypothetical protein